MRSDELGEPGVPLLLPFPFVTQPEFDRLVRLCDRLCVRGEDSLTRALLAGVPFVWQAYRQEEGAHIDKVVGLLERLKGLAPGLTLDPEWCELLKKMNRTPGYTCADTGPGIAPEAWGRFLAPGNERPFKVIAESLASLDLIANLTNFSRPFLQSHAGTTSAAADGSDPAR
jgi:hypothetical protein